MIKRIFTSVLASSIGRKVARDKGNSPIAGAVIGAGTLFAARRLFPQRYALIAATVAAGFLTKKWAARAEEREKSEAAHTADPALVDAAVVDSYAGSAQLPADGQSMGDALPPAIPIDAKGHAAVNH